MSGGEYDEARRRGLIQSNSGSSSVSILIDHAAELIIIESQGQLLSTRELSQAQLMSRSHAQGLTERWQMQRQGSELASSHSMHHLLICHSLS